MLLRATDMSLKKIQVLDILDLQWVLFPYHRSIADICLNLTCKLHGDIFDASVTKLKGHARKDTGSHKGSGRGASLENIIETEYNTS